MLRIRGRCTSYATATCKGCAASVASLVRPQLVSRVELRGMIDGDDAQGFSRLLLSAHEHDSWAPSDASDNGASESALT